MPRRELISIAPVNDYDTIHPALDFWKNQAIVSVGCKWKETWASHDNNGKIQSTETRFTTSPFCIMSTGEKFRYDKDELAKRNLFFSGRLELPEQSRWDYNDIYSYSENYEHKPFPELYELIRYQIEYYMDFIDDRYYDLLSCFIIYTYFYPLFFNAPVLQFWGEMKSGKTKTLSLLEAMVFNPINSANISSASVFRLTESRRAIILFDESEDLMTADRSREIRNMLLAGTGKSGETYRQEKGSSDNYHTQTFRVFSPKVIANIAGINMPALLSRIIRITTIATKNHAKDNLCVELEDKKWQLIRNELYRICLSEFNKVIETRNNLTQMYLTGRTLYTWQGILAIAKLVSNDVFDKLIELATDNREDLSTEIEDYSDDPHEIVSKLSELSSNGQQYYTADELLYCLRSMNISSKRDLAMKLGKFGIRSRNLYINQKQARYYFLSKDVLLHL